MNTKGQFSIIAALLVAVVLIAAVMTTYSVIRYDPLQEQPQVLGAIDETNLALKQILGFTVGYYGSVLKVTGNTSFAQNLASNYLSSGLSNIADIRPEWGLSFEVTTLELNANWYTRTSYSKGTIEVTYNLTGLGISGISYLASSRLDVLVSNSSSTTQADFTILKDETEPLINLGSSNLKFYRYIYENSTWELDEAANITSYANGTYVVDLPSGVAGDSYVLQVEDTRGIIVTAASFSRYAITLNWDAKYSAIPNENLVVELLQNGTMRWLGQNFNLTQATKPIPPIPVKAIHVTQTINGVNQEVPFQIEDWASEYRVPLGLTSNASVFNSRTMLVFLANPQVSKVTIWWDGQDTATQTPYAYISTFTSDTNQKTLSNGILDLKIEFSWQDGVNSFKVISTMKTSTATAVLMRLNNTIAHYGWSEPTYAILNGPVRAIVHHEIEWPSGGVPNCPNVYAHIVLTLPANATYYTYQLRFMFLDAGSLNRAVSDFTPIKLSTTSFITQLQTENGTAVANTNSGSNSFYNFSDGTWAHHWSQFISGTKGAGIMFTDTANRMLYLFDTVTSKTGAIKADFANKKIELSPVTSSTQLPTSPLDVTWYGAVATFDDTTPIYRSSDQSGLWLLAEYLPIVTVAAES